MPPSTSIAVLLTLAAAPLAAAEPGRAPDFNREIRPLLAENCYHCHGPDAATRKADLRLDLPTELPENFVDRITHDDPDEVMPPPESKRTLSAAQIDTLKRWADAGAPYAEHWAWTRPERPTPPEFDDPWVRNPIDAFVLARLNQAGLSPSPPAAPHTLSRRLHLDLIGLPPSPGAPADTDTLLASPAFGEKWARHWLDLARYADSNGFQADQLRPSWAFRNWVIDAFNANMPFDRFTIEQLAGDLLPDPTLDQRIATGFHRTVTCNVEAGVHPEENRTNQVVDRVNTTATVWLGVTMECAQCHDHKYDPFSMRDYYRLFAYFNNTPLEVELPSSQTDVSHDFVGPYMDLPLSDRQLDEKNQLQKRLAALRAEQTDLKKSGAAWQPLSVASFASTGQENSEVLDDGSVLLTGPVPDKVTYTLRFEAVPDRITALRLETLTHPDLPGKGPGRGDKKRNNFVLHDLKITLGDDPSPVRLTGTHADFSQKGWDARGATDDDPKSGWAIAPQFSKDHWIAFTPGSRIAPDTPLTLTLTQNFGSGRVLGRPRLLYSSAPAREFREQNRRLTELANQITELEGQIAALEPSRTLVMVEMDAPRPTNILERGQYSSKGDAVTPGTPAHLHPLDPDLPETRLGLARWLTAPENPLTARVTVNRLWAELFGHGIVSTIEDFGTQSEPPTHPELLDWLAVEFIESGWDIKHLLRTITASATYRQASVITPDLRERDPENKLYARGPRFRLSAEAIRDNALAASGLLTDATSTIATVMPHQPAGLWRQTGRNEPIWKDATGPDRFRRGIYIVYRRAAPYPSFVNFDAPDRGSCTVRRARTNTPLQALTLLNDPAHTEFALALADRALAESPDDVGSRLFQLVLNRQPTGRERTVIAGLLDTQGARYDDDPDSARKLIAGAAQVYRPQSADPTRLAATFHLAQAVLNLDEAITKP